MKKKVKEIIINTLLQQIDDTKDFSMIQKCPHCGKVLKMDFNKIKIIPNRILHSRKKTFIKDLCLLVMSDDFNSYTNTTVYQKCKHCRAKVELVPLERPNYIYRIVHQTRSELNKNN